MTIIDSILAKIGLMRVEDHKAETNRLNLELAKQDNALSEAKAKARKATDDLNAHWAEVERLTRGWEKANADISLLRRQLDDSEAELANLRPDAEKWRARLRRDRERRKRGRA